MSRRVWAMFEGPDFDALVGLAPPVVVAGLQRVGWAYSQRWAGIAAQCDRRSRGLETAPEASAFSRARSDWTRAGAASSGEAAGDSAGSATPGPDGLAETNPG